MYLEEKKQAQRTLEEIGYRSLLSVVGVALRLEVLSAGGTYSR